MIRKIKTGWIRPLAVFIASVALWSLFGTVSWVGFQGCGSGGSSGGGATALSEEEDAVCQSIMSLVVALAGGSVDAGALIAKAQSSTSCANGGTMTLNEDGSITFTNCSFGAGQFLNGTIRITGDENSQSIEFDGFSGQSDDTLFEANGTIEKTQNDDGSTTFEFNLESSTTGGGDTDETNLTGEITVQDDFSTTGTLRVNDLNCNFTGQDLRDFADDDSSTRDEICDDSEPIS